MTISFVTWNIKTGGGSRLAAIRAVLRRERPDLLALQELRGFERRIAGFAADLGMVPHLARSVFGQPVAVLVRPPLRIERRASVTWRLHHAAAAVRVGTPAGPLTLVTTHLNPFSPERRRREAIWLASRFRSGLFPLSSSFPFSGIFLPRAAGQMVLIAGDLNGLSPGDDHTEALAGLPPQYRRRHLRPDGTVDTAALTAFDRAGLHDLWPTAGIGDGRSVPTTQGGGAEFGAMRLDYLLGTPAVAGRVRELRVLRGGEFEYASDHYPLRASIDLSQ